MYHSVDRMRHQELTSINSDYYQCSIHTATATTTTNTTTASITSVTIPDPIQKSYLYIL